MLSFDEIWMEGELAKFPIVPDSEQEEASARLVEAENRLPSLTTEPEREPESESEREVCDNFAVKAKHRKHFHACSEEGRYHNERRNNKPEKAYALYNKSEARRKEKETFKTKISSHLAEAEQEALDKAEAEWNEKYYSNLEKYYANIFSDYERGFEQGKEYALKILRTTGVKLTVEGLGEVSFEDLERYYAQML